MPELRFQLPELSFQMPELRFQKPEFHFQMLKLSFQMLKLSFQQALKYRSVTDIVRPIHQIVRRRGETTGHSVRPK